jgi:hypothetical protein
VKELLLNRGTQTLGLTHKGQHLETKVTIHGKFFNFVGETNSISTSQSQNEGEICGLATVLIASVNGLNGNRDELKPSVKVTWGDKEFVTPVKSYSPGTDIFNPSFDTAFRFPVTAEQLFNPSAFRLVLQNGTSEQGAVDIPFNSVSGAQGMVREEEFDVGSGVTVRARVAIRGLQMAQ